jgi:hypothetical protein
MEHSVPERQTRVDKSDRTAETISFDGGKSISTWEDYIPGNFFPFQRSFGGRLLQEEDQHRHVQGWHGDVHDRPPARQLRCRRRGARHLHVEIPPIATTNEALLVDPDNPGNVGLLDQRHDRGVIANIWGPIRKPFNGGNKQLEAPNAGGSFN